jgi:3-oxoacyl-[acyl-carrier protein] reductase
MGRAIAATFAMQGERVVILGHTEEKLRHVVDELGTDVTFEVADVSQREQVEAAIASIINQFGQVSVLVNNAGFVKGITADMPLAEAEVIWEQEIGANLKDSFLMSVGLAPHLVRPGGRIINIGSIAAYTGGSRGGVIGYGTAKAGLHGLTCALARELSPQGITVNTISPGFITETDFFGGGLSAERIQTTVSQVPVGRAGKPEDIAATVGFLASEGASYITGEVIHVNGGWLFGS